jgi:ABC-type phosphate transport system permease subunit
MHVDQAYATAVVLIIVVIIINWLSSVSMKKFVKG